MRTITVAMLASMAFFRPAFSQSQPPSLLAGQLLGNDTGSPIPRATVVAILQQPANQSPIIFRSDAANDGTFQISPPAQYATGVFTICVHNAGNYLDPCEWGTPPTAVAGATPLALRLAKGIRARVRVEDPQNVLASYAGTTTGPPIFVTAVNQQTHAQHVLPLTYQGSGVLDYSRLIADDSNLVLSVTGRNIQFSGVSGQPLASTSAMAMPPAPPTVQLNSVTSRAPFGMTPPQDRVLVLGVLMATN